MLWIRGLFLVVAICLFMVVFSIPNPVIAFTGIKNWSRRVLYAKVDLCTQACYSEIIPGLYLSNARAAADKNVLKHLNITHVLTVEVHRLPKSTFSGTNISSLFIRAYDTPNTNLLPYFPMANAFIDEALKNRGNVIVHCHFGVSRSATLVIAYIMEKYELTFEQAFRCVKNRRRFINPNPGFVRQLQEYERLNYDVSGIQRFEAFVNVNARKHKYKIVSLAAIFVGLLVPIAVLVG